MSATFTISSSEIRQIFQPSTSNASRFWELAQKANELAVIIEARWDRIPAETRELLKTLVYAFIEKPEGIQGTFLHFLKRFSWGLALFLNTIKGEQDALIAYYGAFERLLNAILSGIEREDVAYQKALSEALEESFAEWESSKAMTAEEACERIRAISNQALE